MANLKQMANEALATIDTAMAILHKFPDLGEGQEDVFSSSGAANPYQLLLELIKHTKGYNAVIGFISKFLAYVTPEIEAAIKAALTLSLKDILITCSVNPFLNEEILEKGVDLNIADIDINNMLMYSPFDPNCGSSLYFGVEEVKKPEDIVKTNDMNALIWFMLNKANKRYVWKPKKNRQDPDFRFDYPHTIGDPDTLPYEAEQKMYNEPLAKLESEKNTLKAGQYEKKKKKIIENWRKYRKNYRKNGYYKLKKEDGIVTFEFNEHSTSLKDAYGNAYATQTPYNNCLHVFIGDVREISGNAKIKELTDSEAAISENDEKYQVFATQIQKKEAELAELQKDNAKDEENFANQNFSNADYEKALKDFKKSMKAKKRKEEVLQRDLRDLRSASQKLTEAKRQLQNSVANIKKELKHTKDQYFPFLGDSEKHRNYFYGKTILEFDYDYIDSLQFFDPKTLLYRLIESLTGQFTYDIKLSYKQRLIQNEVKKMIEMMNETDDVVISDCFFSFSNDDYDKMYNQAELEKAGFVSLNGEEFSSVKLDTQQILSQINQISDSSTPEQIESVVNGTLTDLSREVTTSTDAEMVDEIGAQARCRFIENTLNCLAYALITTVLSPKVYILLMLNLKIIGQHIKFNYEEFLGQYNQIIGRIIRMVKDELLKFLTQQVLNIVRDLAKEVANKLCIEQAKYYYELIRRLVDCFKRENEGLDFNIDDVDYADILPSEEQEPQPENC